MPSLVEKVPSTVSCTLSGANSNTITATGHCASLTVSGSSNQVSIESADTISTSAVGNAITYQSGTPRVTTAGVSNTVSRR